MNNRVGIAVVGCGYWGSKHVRICHESPLLDLKLAVDARRDCLDYISAQYGGIKGSQHFEDALGSDAQGVIIATPISTHYTLAKAALLAGKHVLVEKPLAMTSQQCKELIAIADEKRLVLMVGHTFEYHPAVAVVRDIVRSGRIGKPYYANSRRLNLGLYQADSNVLWDLAPHDLSILFSVLDGPVNAIDAWGCRHVLPTVEDVVYTKLTLANGATAHIHVSWLDPIKVRQFTLVGSKGMLVFDDGLPTEKVKIYDQCFNPFAEGDTFADFQSAYHHGDVEAPEIPPGEPLQIEVLDFANAIATGTQPRADGRRGLQVVDTLERISRRLDQPKTVGSERQPFASASQLSLS